jgi:hypothetical protein
MNVAMAIDQWRHVQVTLKEKQRLNRQVLFESMLPPPRRKRLRKKVLGTRSHLINRKKCSKWPVFEAFGYL